VVGAAGLCALDKPPEEAMLVLGVVLDVLVSGRLVGGVAIVNYLLIALY